MTVQRVTGHSHEKLFWRGSATPTKSDGVRIFSVRYYHAGFLSGVPHVTDSAGDLVAATTWYPYGSRLGFTGMQPLLSFAGAEDDGQNGPATDLGLLHYGSRRLSSAVGRWVSMDRLALENPRFCADRPLECNGYSYSGNDPVNFVDPTGMYRDVADIRVQRQEDGSKHISFTYMDGDNRLDGYLTSVEVMDDDALWRDAASGKNMRAPLEKFLNSFSYAVYHDSRANSFAGGKVRSGFFADAVIERYHNDVFWNRVANAGDAMGGVAVGLSIVPEPTAVTKVAATTLGVASGLISVGTNARTFFLARSAASALNTVGQAAGMRQGMRQGLRGVGAGAAAVGVSQLQQFFVTVRDIKAINNDAR